MSEAVYTIRIKDCTLKIIYDKMEYGLYNMFSSDSRMYDYTHSKTEEALMLSINTQSENIYILNIASTENFGAFELECSSNILHRQMDIFMPVIQMFMEYALTGKIDFKNIDEATR